MHAYKQYLHLASPHLLVTDPLHLTLFESLVFCRHLRMLLIYIGRPSGRCCLMLKKKLLNASLRFLTK